MQNISYVIADPKDEHCLGLIAGKKEGPWFFYGLKTVLQVSFQESIYGQKLIIFFVNSLKELSTRLQQFQMPSLKSEKQHQKIKKKERKKLQKNRKKKQRIGNQISL